jgi:ATP-dependent helicase/nuclease subunit A
MKSTCQIASDPNHSIWVSASAGTGKTKTLTDRVLRILLEKIDPRKILCLTFTKAAACEMQTRIYQELSSWSLITNDDLVKKLHDLSGDAPDHETILYARNLINYILNHPDGIKIQTIHSFCQNILKKFPIEAGITPHFEVIDDNTTNHLLTETRNIVLQAIKTENLITKDIKRFISNLSIDGFDDILSEIISARSHIIDIINQYNSIEDYTANLYKYLDINQHDDIDSLIKELCNSPIISSDYINILLEKGGKNDKETANILIKWQEESLEKRIEYIDSYKNIFLTQKNEPRKNIVNKKIADLCPNILDILQQEQQRVIYLNEKIKLHQNAELSLALTNITLFIVNIYEAKKREKSYADYDDLIRLAKNLLCSHSARNWILYKLDHTIDHILIDEAQDTSPNQWAIIASICEEFFHQETDIKRSLFVVGDDKQSIFSFQGASPEHFYLMEKYFANKIDKFQTISLDKSYRSLGSILGIVDKICNNDNIKNSISPFKSEITHHIHRIEHEGKVTLWPVIEADKKAKNNKWETPLEKFQQQYSSQALAHKIALYISNMLASNKYIYSKKRNIMPADFLILVRTRTKLVSYIIRELKNLNIPVAGNDRINLQNNLAILDLISIAKFVLMPDNDLNTACLLKSPLLQLSDNDLIILSIGREKKSIWQVMQANSCYQQQVTILQNIIDINDFNSILDFYHNILYKMGFYQNFTSYFGNEVIDIIDEFQNLIINYQNSDNPQSLHYFIKWFKKNNKDIKRDNHNFENEVRIMTAHASKGLQAPIVILPDTISMPKFDSNLLFPNNELCLWNYGSYEEKPNILKSLIDKEKQKISDEYYRLLYVSLTRAEDELIICGYKNSDSNISEKCWYSIISNYLEIDNSTYTSNKYQEEKSNKFSLPDFITSKISYTAKENKNATDSNNNDSVYTIYGTAIHILLEKLPVISPSNYAKTAQNLLKNTDEIIRDKAINKAISVLSNKNLSWIFAANTIAEMPVYGEIIIDDKAIYVNGKIDRVIINNDKIIIIDYKTGEYQENIPSSYAKQLKIYAQLLLKIYPNTTIETKILWIEQEKLVNIDYF